ncbi:MAG TPA: hypothetical protein VFZ61_31150 [Polyangiales bacterium]
MTHDPPRLKDGADTPPELGAALDALRRGPGDSARAARVAAKLGPLLDAPPPPLPPAPTVLPRAGLHTLKAVRVFVAGMAVGASVLWASRWQRHEPPPPAHAAPHEAPSPSRSSRTLPTPPPSTSAAAAHAERSTSANDEGGTSSAGPGLEVAAAAQEPWPSRAQAPSRAGSRGVTQRPAASGRRAGRSAPVAPTTALETAAPSVDVPQPRAEQPEQPSAAPPAAPKGEVELLFEARTLRQRAPREALALLDQHAARFADGMLAPEREAMAIEILHSLGQTQQAAERLARYRARYPRSLHLPRLEKALQQR